MTSYDEQIAMESLFSNGRHLVSAILDFTISVVVQTLVETLVKNLCYFLVSEPVKSREYGKTTISADVVSL